MKLTNLTRMAAAYAMGRQPDGRDVLVLVAKGTFEIPPDGAEPRLARKQADPVDADVHAGEPGFSSTLYECDFAPRKPKCDVLLNGSAYAPGGRPATRVPVLLQVGPMRKSFDVVGPRAWVKGLLGVAATNPVEFRSLRISYDCAFGGVDRAEEPWHYYPYNHAGVGFHVRQSAVAIDGKPLPCTEESGKEVSDPRGKYRPMAFGAVGRAWQPRVALAGTYDKKWLDDVCPFLPADFKDEYYQATPTDQQMPYPRGGEEIALLNLTPQGRTRFRLPALQVPVRFFRRDGDAVETEGVIDTIVIEPDLERFTMTWRSSLPLRRSVFEIVEIVIGHMSRGMSRAHSLGKAHYRSLAELAESRRI